MLYNDSFPNNGIIFSNIWHVSLWQQTKPVHQFLSTCVWACACVSARMHVAIWSCNQMCEPVRACICFSRYLQWAPKRTGTPVITWRHFLDSDHDKHWLLHINRKLLNGLQSCYWMPTSPSKDYSTCETSVLYIIAFLHQSVKESAHLQS